MKQQFPLFWFVFLLCGSSALAQTLFTENFESYNYGAFSNNIDGTIATHSGWYAQVGLLPLPWYASGAYVPDNLKVVADPVKGKVLHGFEQRTVFGEGVLAYIYREDLDVFWQQRSFGNNVLKVSFDLHTGKLFEPNVDMKSIMHLYLRGRNNNNLPGDLLLGMWFDTHIYSEGLIISGNAYDGTLGGRWEEEFKITNLPEEEWITVALYLDYDNDRMYLSIPETGYTLGIDTQPLVLPVGPGPHETDHTPVSLGLHFWHDRSNLPVYGLKIDNINISAQNTAPALGVEKIDAERFNVFPNPTTGLLTVTNNENVGIQQIEVLDSSGKIIKTQSFANESNVNIDLSAFASGIYMLHIKTEQGTAVKKLIKN